MEKHPALKRAPQSPAERAAVALLTEEVAVLARSPPPCVRPCRKPSAFIPSALQLDFARDSSWRSSLLHACYMQSAEDKLPSAQALSYLP